MLRGLKDAHNQIVGEGTLPKMGEWGRLVT